MWKVGGIKIVTAASRRIILPEIGENLHFFIKRSAPENFQRENFSKGVPTETLRTHGSEYVY